MKRFVLLGHPVGHSISPAIHRAAYRALGRNDCRYEAVDCADERAVAVQVASLRRGELGGANVTVPYKRLALDLADEATPLATKTGAANVLSLRDGRVLADNTDVLALREELASAAPPLDRAVVLGAGGAALAAVVALHSLGSREIVVTSRRWTEATREEAWMRAEDFRSLGARPVAWPPSSEAFSGDPFLDAGVIVQATSAGMAGASPGDTVGRIVAWDRLRPGALAYEVVYNPPETPFLAAARAHGVKARGGLGMLVGQAAHALTIWLGVTAPTAAMAEAAAEALFGNPK